MQLYHFYGEYVRTYAVECAQTESPDKSGNYNLTHASPVY